MTEKKGDGKENRGKVVDIRQMIGKKFNDEKKVKEALDDPSKAFIIDSEDALITAFWSSEWIKICNIDDDQKRERMAGKFLEKMARNKDLYGVRLFVQHLLQRIENLENLNSHLVGEMKITKDFVNKHEDLITILQLPFWKRWAYLRRYRKGLLTAGKGKNVKKKEAKDAGQKRENKSPKDGPAKD